MSHRRRHRWIRRLAAGLAPSMVPADRPSNRLSHSKATAQPGLAGSSWAFEGGETLVRVIRSAVLGLGLGPTVGHLRRPRLAGA